MIAPGRRVVSGLSRNGSAVPASSAEAGDDGEADADAEREHDERLAEGVLDQRRVLAPSALSTAMSPLRWMVQTVKKAPIDADRRCRTASRP